jgi:phospholipid/cholesterol/gamma-HCH transport system substrate-binding protein
LAWSELKIGVLTIVAIAIAATLIFTLTGSRGFFWQRYALKTRFDSVPELAPGSPVRVAGKEVGSVKSVEFAGEQVDVVFEVNKDVRPLITTASLAKLGSVSLLGEGAVDITAAPGGTPIKDWGYVKSGIAEGSIAQLTGQASSGLKEAQLLVADLRKGRGTMGKLLTDEALYKDLDAFITSSERVAAAINNGHGTMGKLTNDPQLYNELNQSIANLNAITARVKNGEGSLGQLMNDPAFSKTLTQTTQNFETLSAKLNKGEGTAGKLLNDDALYKRLDSVTSRLDTVLQNLNDGQGTAGQLLHDKQLYENMNQTITEMRALIAEIRKDPKKYLNVKVSVF